MEKLQQADIGSRVSVALCTYNGERYLDAQLASFARQTLQPYELVVCDDGSTDSTLDMVKAFAKTVSFPIHLHVNATTLGSSKNFERAIQLCTGDLIALSDQDDVWLPNKLEVLANLLIANPELGGVFSDGELIDDNSRKLGRGLWDTFGFGAVQQRKFQRQGAPSVLITRVIATGATLMIRASVRPLCFPIPFPWVHDAWIAWTLAIYSRLSFCPERLIRYRVHASQQVGIGANSLAQRIRRAKTTASRDYLALADELAGLRDHLIDSSPPGNDILLKLQGKIDHCRRCAALPTNPILRLAGILAHVRDYYRYSRPFRSMGKDILGAF